MRRALVVLVAGLLCLDTLAEVPRFTAVTIEDFRFLDGGLHLLIRRIEGADHTRPGSSNTQITPETVSAIIARCDPGIGRKAPLNVIAIQSSTITSIADMRWRLVSTNLILMDWEDGTYQWMPIPSRPRVSSGQRSGSVGLSASGRQVIAWDGRDKLVQLNPGDLGEVGELGQMSGKLWSTPRSEVSLADDRSASIDEARSDEFWVMKTGPSGVLSRTRFPKSGLRNCGIYGSAPSVKIVYGTNDHDGAPLALVMDVDGKELFRSRIDGRLVASADCETIVALEPAYKLVPSARAELKGTIWRPRQGEQGSFVIELGRFGVRGK